MLAALAGFNNNSTLLDVNFKPQQNSCFVWQIVSNHRYATTLCYTDLMFSNTLYHSNYVSALKNVI